MMKLPIREIIKQEYDVKIDKNEAMSNEYLIKQGDSIIFDQIKRLRGYTSSHISEMVLIVAKKNPKTEKELKRILMEFTIIVLVNRLLKEKMELQLSFVMKFLKSYI